MGRAILRPYQSDLRSRIYEAWETHKNVLAVLPTGGGKCLGRGTPVLMFDGSTKAVEDVVVGDLLLGPDGTKRRVLSTCSGREPLYRVIQNKGDDYVVNESHILSLKQTGLTKNPKRPCEMGKGRVVNIGVKEYLSASNYFRHAHKGWRASVSFRYKKVNPALPPYLLGLWLGDGSAGAPEITTADPEIVAYLQDYADTRGFSLVVQRQPNNASSVYRVSNNWKREGTLLSALRQYNLFRNKHIPTEYKTGSRDQRMQLLAGLIDSDGSVSKSGFEITFKSKRLIDDTAFVARSLGFAVSINSRIVKGTEYFRAHINGAGRFLKLPTKIPRKTPSKRLQDKNPLVTGIRLEPLGEGDYFGFEITGDRLFLLGDFTVTHNTVTFSDIVHDHRGASAAIAHRQELVSQISLALARDEVRHRIIGPPNVVKMCVSDHMEELGTSFYDPNAQCGVAGVDTLIRRGGELERWANSVSLWVQDEAHHLLKENKWGKAAKMFPNAKGLGVTATPTRADGKGLGRWNDGLFDELVVGPSMRDLINAGYLTEYRIFAPASDFDRGSVPVSETTGDFNPTKMKTAIRRSHVIGDVVKHYLRIAPGKLGVTFAPDVETATDIAKQFNLAGVPAEVVSAKTLDRDRKAILRRFKRRELLQLVNVDLFGEGFDLPAIEVVSMARPTMSYALFVQQFGRSLRLLDGKLFALIIDHVGNVETHGLPDAPRAWSLEARERRSRGTPDDVIPVKACPECTSVYERVYPACPFCGFKPLPMARSGPQFVDGDLHELDPETLARLRGEIARVDMDKEAYRLELASKHTPKIGQLAHVKTHAYRQEAQRYLRDAIAWWAGYQRAAGRSDSESYRRFYFMFGTDVLSAQALGTKEALALAERINEKLRA